MSFQQQCVEMLQHLGINDMSTHRFPCRQELKDTQKRISWMTTHIDMSHLWGLKRHVDCWHQDSLVDKSSSYNGTWLCHSFTSCCHSTLYFFLTDDEIRTVNTPGFADSVTEGDIRWEKGKIDPDLCRHMVSLGHPSTHLPICTDSDVLSLIRQNLSCWPDHLRE